MKLFKVDCFCDKSGNKKRFSHCIPAKSGEYAIKKLIDALEKYGKDLNLRCRRGNDYTCLMYADGNYFAYYYGFTADEIVLIRDNRNWVPCDDSDSPNISQESYLKLLNADGTRELSDDIAVEFVCEEYGFNRSKVKIIHSVGVYEKDTLTKRLRKIDEAERKPLFNSRDWNYVCFDCANWSYEMYNGKLRQL